MHISESINKRRSYIALDARKFRIAERPILDFLSMKIQCGNLLMDRFLMIISLSLDPSSATIISQKGKQAEIH